MRQHTAMIDSLCPGTYTVTISFGHFWLRRQLNLRVDLRPPDLVITLALDSMTEPDCQLANGCNFRFRWRRNWRLVRLSIGWTIAFDPFWFQIKRRVHRSELCSQEFTTWLITDCKRLFRHVWHHSETTTTRQISPSILFVNVSCFGECDGAIIGYPFRRNIALRYHPMVERWNHYDGRRFQPMCWA